MLTKVMKQIPLILVLLALTVQPLGFRRAVLAADVDSADPAQYSNDWRPTGPPGGDVRDLVVDPNNPDRFYFGTLDGQVYTSVRWR